LKCTPQWARIPAVSAEEYSPILRNWRVDAVAAEEVDANRRNRRLIASFLISDANSAKWLLDEIQEDQYEKFLRLAECLENLKERGIKQVQAYEHNTLGQFVTFYSGRLYMLRPQPKGSSLTHSQWLADRAKIGAFVDFLAQLKSTSAALPHLPAIDGKSIIDYIRRTTDTFQRHRPELAERLSPILKHLEATLFITLPTTRLSLCHSNLVDENLHWTGSELSGVSGWEFCDMKNEAYDAALVAGCIGFDDPDRLVDDPAQPLIGSLNSLMAWEAESWASFYDLMIAIRFGWLSKWMRINDEKTRDKEVLYMNYLVTQRDFIRRTWGLQ
jgi:homoserine kinase type II